MQRNSEQEVTLGGHTTTTPEGESVHLSHADYEAREGRLARMWYEEGIWAHWIDPHFQFKLGHKYLTLGGDIVTILVTTGPVDISGLPNRGYECVMGSDHIWRYNRSYESKSHDSAAPDGLGRTTGSSWSRLTNLVPIELDGGQGLVDQTDPLVALNIARNYLLDEGGAPRDGYAEDDLLLIDAACKSLLIEKNEYVWRWRWASNGSWRYTETDERPDIEGLETIAPVEFQRVRVVS